MADTGFHGSAESSGGGAAVTVMRNVRVVLAEPSEPRNVGASCRVMRNFGVEQLTVVAGSALDIEAARPLAVGAEAILDSARIVTTLSEAVRESSLVVGVTRRIGEKRKGSAFLPWEIAGKAQDHKEAVIALVFGNERAGLSDVELQQCHLALTIPSAPHCPSLNLSHAVGIVCYELQRAKLLAASEAAERRQMRADAETLERSVSRIVISLAELGYPWRGGPRGMRTFLRDLLARAVPTYAELSRFQALFSKLAGMHGKREGDGT